MLLKKVMAKGGIPLKLSILLSVISAIGVFILSNLTLNMFTDSHKKQIQVLGHSLAISLESDIQSSFEATNLESLQPHVEGLLLARSNQSHGLLQISVIDAKSRNYLASTLPSNLGKRATSALREILENGEDDQTYRQDLVMDINEENVKVIQFSRKVFNRQNPEQLEAYVQVLFKRDQFFLGNQAYKRNMLLVSSMIVIIIFLGAFVISTSVSRGVKVAKGAVDLMSEDQFEIYLPDRGDEIGVLNKSLENLRDVLKKRHVQQVSAQTRHETSFSSDSPSPTRLNQFEATGLHIEMHNLSKYTEKHPVHEIVHLMEGLLAYLNKQLSNTDGTLEYFNGQMAFVTFRGDQQIRQAVEAALEFQAGIHAASKDLGLKDEESLQVSIGLHKGMMVAGRISRDDIHFGAAMGTTVQLGLALAKSAGPGEIMISSRIYGLVKDDYQFIPVNSQLELLKDAQLQVFILGRKQDRAAETVQTQIEDSSRATTPVPTVTAPLEEKQPIPENELRSTPPNEGSKDVGGIAAMLEETFDDFVMPPVDKQNRD